MDNLVDVVREAGVVGAGGAGFPTHVKLAAQAEFLIINGVECEPLLQVDQYLMTEYAKPIVETVEKVRQQVGAKKAFVTLKEKYTEARQALEAVAKDFPAIEVSVFPSVYPMGDEHVLVYETVGRVVPAGGIPLDVGVVGVNVETIWNIYQAIQGEPLVDTYLSVVGEVPEPMTIKAPLGTVTGELLSILGVNVSGLEILEGGPMMGGLTTLDTPLQKTSKGLFLLKPTNPVIYRRKQSVNTFLKIARAACCHCNFCTENCPRYLLGHPLEPHRIMWGVSIGEQEDFPAFEGVQYCCECGVCELYSCPMEISPRRIIQNLKKTATVERKKIDEPSISELRETRKVPTSRLEARLALTDYHQPAPWKDIAIRPKSVRIALKSHVGVPSEPIVNVGDSVRRGQKIATIPEGKLGANIHASIDGRVAEIADGFVRIDQ